MLTAPKMPGVNSENEYWLSLMDSCLLLIEYGEKWKF